MYDTFKSMLFRLDAETAHRLTLRALKLAPAFLLPAAPKNDAALKNSIWGRSFPNPVGLAAGFDKNAEAIAPLFRLGFGFVEAGTVTLKPQTGNPRPRVFRAPAAKAIINRMGFPNLGAAVFKTNVTTFLMQRPRLQGVLGINIGMNKEQTDPAKDYMALVRSLGAMADYLTINISSPNTPGLRNLQEPSVLRELLTNVLSERAASCGNYPPPLLVKLAPDLNDDQLQGIASVLSELKIDGVILSNTTLERPSFLDAAFAAKKGGLSGAPLRDKSTHIIASFYKMTQGQIPIIGVGGITCAADAYAKIRAGASLVQIYSGMVFYGPSLIQDINTGLVTLLKQDGFSHISEAIGADHRQNNTQGHDHALCA